MSHMNCFPEGCRGAVSLTFDDGLPSHLSAALPVLEEFGLKGTFYLNPQDIGGSPGSYVDRLSPWKPAADNGHEMGNHSLLHTCSRAMQANPAARGLETATLQDIEEDVVEAEKRLRSVFGHSDRSFAYPCYLDYVGEGVTRQSYVPIIARHFRAARGKSPAMSLNQPATCSMTYLYSQGCERMSASELIGIAARAYMQGAWAIFTFHGVNEGHLPISEADLREFCLYLGRFNPGVWVAPVIDVAVRISERRASATGALV